MIETVKNSIFLLLIVANVAQNFFLILGPLNDQQPIWRQYTAAWKKTGVLALHLLGLQHGEGRKYGILALVLLPVCGIGFLMVSTALGRMF